MKRIALGRYLSVLPFLVSCVLFPIPTFGAAPAVFDDEIPPVRSQMIPLHTGAQEDKNTEIWNRVFEQTWVRNVNSAALYPVLPNPNIANGKAVIVIPVGLFEDPFKYLKQSEQQAQHITERAQLAADKDAPLGNWRGKGKADSAVSLIESLQTKGINFTYAKGADVQVDPSNFIFPVKVNNDDRSGFAEAIDAASKADKVVLVLGESAYMSGEGRSRAHLGLPGVQQALLEAVHAVNPNIVLVVMSGRPQVLTWADQHVPAILQAWHLGTQSGNALANINPSGKLPMTFPRTEGQIPIYYNLLSTGRPGPMPLIFWRHYADKQVTPLYPFGHGLSYTDFTYSNLKVEKAGETVIVSAEVTNTGKVSGKEVVQLYIRDMVSSVSRPVKELKGFEKVLLNAGEKQTVSFTSDASALGYKNSQGQLKFEPGEFTFFVGGSSDTSLAKKVMVSL